MAPTLQKIVLNGASRHRLKKGFLLVKEDGQPIETILRDKIVNLVNQGLAGRSELADFKVEISAAYSSLVLLVTPFHPVYDVQQRDKFIYKLATATKYLFEGSTYMGCSLLASGVNACFADNNGQREALCADIHQIEIFDDGEVERIYNMYRQLLPELLAISAHSSIYGATLQKDFSLRMRLNQSSSFLPRYLSQFNAKQLEQLKRVMRKDYKLADIHQMDVNPLSGDTALLTQDDPPPLLKETPAAVELRFVDAQCSFPFIRAQVILFQAIAMYGRFLAREGMRLPYMRDEVIDENKALALQNGATAILQPDPDLKNDGDGKGYSHHHKGSPERATTALLMAIDGLLLPALQDLGCEPWELFPIVLGAELRRRGKRCLANYAEYQQYLWYTQQSQFASIFQQQTRLLLTSSTLDVIKDYNQQHYRDLSSEISKSWIEKLTQPTRYIGNITRYDPRDGRGNILSEQKEEFPFYRNDVEGVRFLDKGQSVTFEVRQRREGQVASRIRIVMGDRHAGRVIRFDTQKGYGFIRDKSNTKEIFVHFSDVTGRINLKENDYVSFEVLKDKDRFKAVHVYVHE